MGDALADTGELISETLRAKAETLPVASRRPAPIHDPVGRSNTPIPRGIVLGILVAVLLLVTLGSAWATYHQERRYENLARQADVHRAEDFRWALAFEGQLAVVQDLLVLRFAGIFLSTALILVGCCFVLTGIEAAFDLDGGARDAKVALRTSSPGLVLITLGGVLFFGALFRTTTFSRPSESTTGAPAARSSPPDDEIVIPPHAESNDRRGEMK